jgi:hypothetical protein
MTNPFYVQPGNELGPGLMGLAQTVEKVGLRKKAEQKEQIMRNEISTAIESKDPDKIRTVAGKYPELGTKIKDIMEMQFPGGSLDAYKNALFSASVDFTQAPQILEKLRSQFAQDGIDPQEQAKLDEFKALLESDPKTAQKNVEAEFALLADKEIWGKYKDLTKKEGSFTLSKGQTRYTASGDIIIAAPKGAPTPHSDIAKLKEDLSNGLISSEDYLTRKEKILNPEAKNKTELTARALKGDMEALNILNAMGKSDIEMAQAKGEAAALGKISGLQKAMDLEGTAKAILEGRETIENVKNTFGVPIQEAARKMVLEQEPNFNFVQPRAVVKSLSSSLMQQQKNRGMMGSFVKNINKQVDRLTEIGNDMVSRVGTRALDLPIRELHTRFIGSGNERVFEAYMKEISAEIAKLAQGSAASVAQLPEENRKDWERIHDVNLSMRDLTTILRGTKEMANIRLDSVQDEIDSTIDSLGNVRNKQRSEIKYIEGQTATGPNGEKVIFKNGSWENL